MHRSLLLLPSAVLMGVLALGCDDQHSPMTPSGSPDPSLRVERGTESFGLFLTDGRSSMIFGHTLEEVVRICEETQFDVPAWDQLLVTRPTGREGFEESFKLLQRARDLPVVVFANPPLDVCDLLETPLFTGTAQAIIADNDAFLTHHGANAFNLRVTGSVTDESGQQYHLVARILSVLSRESTPDNQIPLNFFEEIQRRLSGNDQLSRIWNGAGDHLGGQHPSV